MKHNNKDNKNKSNSYLELISDKEKLLLINLLESYYGVKLKDLFKYYFYINRNSNKIFISSVNINDISINRISGIGIYFGSYHDNNRFRLSIEGSKFINPKKNYIEINFKTLQSYLSAENLFIEEVDNMNYDKSSPPFLIVKYNEENIGCISVKNNVLLNYIPKSRKLDYNKLF